MINTMIKKVQIKIALIALLSLFFMKILTAQVDVATDRKAIAAQSITALKNGTLILRLKSKNNKLTKLQEILDKGGLDSSRKAKIKKEIKSTIEERDAFNSSLVNAFEEYYSFSKIYYMYDTASVALRDGAKRGIFLNKGLEPDPQIKIPLGRFFVIKAGTTDGASTTGIAALVMMDENLKDLNRPFPYYVRINSVGRLFTRIFNHKNLVKKDSTKVVLKLEGNLRRYYSRVKAGGQ